MIVGENVRIHNKSHIGGNGHLENNVVIEEDVQIGHHVILGNGVVIRKGCRIGSNVVIGHNTVVERDCYIGDGTRIQALVYLAWGTRIEKRVFIGPMVCTTNDRRILSHGRGEFKPNAPQIEFGARIGARALIMPGVRVGRNALIGAGAIIDNDADAGQVWMGAKGKRTGVVPKEELLDGKG